MRMTGHLGRGGPHKKVLEENREISRFSCVPSIQSDKDSRGGPNAAQQSRTREKALRQHRQATCEVAGALSAVEKVRAG